MRQTFSSRNSIDPAIMPTENRRERMATVIQEIPGFLRTAAENIFEGYEDILTKGCDERWERPISLSHFLPYTKFENGLDLSNGDLYWNDDPKITRLKCLGLTVATPIVHAIGLVLNLANRVTKIITFAHFHDSATEGRSLSEKSWAVCKDLLRIAFTPIIYLGLELSAIYGLALPENGRKLYATFERCAYGKELLAPCFQPFATRHLGGGIPGQTNAW